MRTYRQAAFLTGIVLVCASATTIVSGQDAPQPPWDDDTSDIEIPAEYADYFAQDGAPVEADFASLLQQPPSLQPNTASTQPAPRRYATGGRQAGNRLASVPHMFGDCGMTTGTATIIGVGGKITNAEFMLPMVGGSRTGKIAENDVALPVDRVFFNYNHYSNIFTMQEQQLFPQTGPALNRAEPIDRYTLGAEKTFLDGWMSVELRMPFNGSFNANLPDTGVSIGNVGNMAVLVKSMLYRNDNLGIGGGLAIDCPTGSTTVARIDTVNMQFLNQACHLLPYLGFLYSPGDPQLGWGDGLFMTGFVQVDIATSGNTVQFINPIGGATQSLGKYNEQNVLFADLAVGYWLYRNPDAPRWTGFAVVSEAHYTSSLQNADLVAGANNGIGAVVTNTSNRFDVVNGTIALQALMFDASSLRIGGVFPMGRSDDKRFFDSEVQVQFTRRF